MLKMLSYQSGFLKKGDLQKVRKNKKRGEKECLPFTEKIRKFRLECKWKEYFGSPNRKISEINGTSSGVLQNSQPEYPNGKLCSIYFFLPVPRPTPIVRLVPDSM